MSDKPLTPKQERFVDEYLVDLNATQAAIRAGYAPGSAHVTGPRLLGNARVKGVVAERQQAAQERLELSQDYVLGTIHNTVERCRQAVPVLDRRGDPVFVETPSGEVVPAYTFDARAVLKGTELIGKHLGMFKEGPQVEQNFNFTIVSNIPRPDA